MESRIKRDKREFLKSFWKAKRMKTWQDWYRVTNQDIKNFGGSWLFSPSESAISTILQNIYPEHDWEMWRFSRVPDGFWKAESNRRRFLDSFAANHNIKDMEDWYNVKIEDIWNYGGRGLHHECGDSLSTMLLSAFPTYEWKIWKFSRVPEGFWDDFENQKVFLENFTRKRKMAGFQDWYDVLNKDVIEAGGAGLLSKYGGSKSKMLQSVFPQYQWKIWKFDQVPAGYWKVRTNQEDFLKSFALEKNMEWEDWYEITNRDIKTFGGQGLLAELSGSLAKVIPDVFPSHDWKFWKFSHVPQDLWKHYENQLQFFQSLVFSGNVNQSPHWRTFSRTLITRMGGAGLLHHYKGNVQLALRKVFPEFREIIEVDTSSRPQQILQRILEEIVTVPFEINFRHRNLKHKSGAKMELDFWIPKWKVALEYQGEQHFHQLWEKSKKVLNQKRRDREKEEACFAAGITLIKIPFWWNKSKEQLIATIRKSRTDLLTKYEKVVDESAAVTENLPDKSVIAQSLMNPVDYKGIDPTNWWFSEKFDGIRGFWDGKDFYSKQAVLIRCPEDFKAKMPSVQLDGELWIGPERFWDLQTTLRSQDWSNIRFKVFDICSAEFRGLPFENRLTKLEEILSGVRHPNLEVVKYKRCQNRTHLTTELFRVISRGGEGIMLREPESKYESGRSPSLQKFKPQYVSTGVVIQPQFARNTMFVKSSVELDFKFYQRISDAKFGEVTKGTKVLFKFNSLTRFGTPKNSILLKNLLRPFKK